MHNYTSAQFWKGAVERAIRTAAQTVIALIGTDQVGILDLDWAQIGSVAATATLLSVLMSIAGGGAGSGPSFTEAEAIPAGTDDGPSIVGEEAFFDDQDEEIEEDEDLAELASSEGDATPVSEAYQPRH